MNLKIKILKIGLVVFFLFINANTMNKPNNTLFTFKDYSMHMYGVIDPEFCTIEALIKKIKLKQSLVKKVGTTESLTLAQLSKSIVMEEAHFCGENKYLIKNTRRNYISKLNPFRRDSILEYLDQVESIDDINLLGFGIDAKQFIVLIPKIKEIAKNNSEEFDINRIFCKIFSSHKTRLFGINSTEIIQALINYSIAYNEKNGCQMIQKHLKRNNFIYYKMILNRITTSANKNSSHLNLFGMNINDNQLALIMPLISKNKNLKTLKLTNNNLTKIAKYTFNGLPNLVNLFIDYNQIYRIHPEAFNLNLMNLKSVNLTENKISNIKIETFLGLDELELINLWLNPNLILSKRGYHYFKNNITKFYVDPINKSLHDQKHITIMY